MEKKQKELLIVQRANLVECLNMRSGLFTQLLCRKIIDQRMVRKIKNGNTEDEQAEDLLDYLPKSEQGPDTFDLFCEALQADSQGNVVKLFLKPENTECSEDDGCKSVGSQESTDNCSVDDGASQGVDTKCTQVTVADVECRDGSRVGGSPSLVPPMAIQEEFQQHLYRRSIQPRELQHSQSSPSIEGSLEHEARFLYQNSLRNPSTIPTVLNNQGYSKMEKEKQLFKMGMPTASIDQLMAEYYMHSKSDPMLVRDSGSKFLPSNYVSSKDFLENAFAQSPSVFHLSPHKDINLSSIRCKIPSDPKPFAFNTGDQNISSVQSVLEGPDLDGASKVYGLKRVVDSVSVVPNIHRGTERMVENRARFYECNQGERVLHEPSSMLPVQEIPSSPSRFTREVAIGLNHAISSPNHLTAERDCIEIPRYIEVNSTGEGGERHSMISLPRHVTMLPVSHHPELRNEELIRGDNLASSRLLRTDSVDTMHKRPLTEQAETGSKRFREDVDTFSVPSLVKPEKLSTLRVFDKIDEQVIHIPVIEEPRKKPSMPAVVVETDKNLETSQRSSLLGAMDDPEIDLTDGPINVSVELSTRQFYMAHYKQAYAMRRIPRGKALVMNVNEVVGKSARRGTDIDRDNLHNLLCQMHFDVTVFNDSDGLTAMEMVQKLQEFSQHPGHMNADCSIVCILSHGEEGYIFGADGKKFELDAVFSLFDNTCCPSLRGKPKIFIIQACRGGALDRGVQYYPDEHDGADARVRQVPSMSDMLICYPTQNGYYAWRNRDRGSWYVEALVQIFMKYSRCEDLCTMLNRVNLLVSKKVSHCPNIDMDQMSQMSEYKSTLRMPHLYFFPGIGGCS